jgi:amino acid permease
MNDWLKYLIPAAFLLLAGFNLYAARWLEAALYVSVGVAFPLMWAIRDGLIKSHLKFWNLVAWLLVFVALLLFFAVLQLDGHSLI